MSSRGGLLRGGSQELDDLKNLQLDVKSFQIAEKSFQIAEKKVLVDADAIVTHETKTIAGFGSD